MAAPWPAVAAPSPPSYSTCRSMGDRHLWCLCRGGRVDRPERGKTPLLLKIAVSGVTELLRLLPAAPRKESKNTRVREAAPSVRSVEDVVSILRSDYEKAYFLTGDFTSEIYTVDCLFEDPTIKFYGRDRYSQNLDLLVPFFDRPSLELEKIEKCVDGKREFVLATWILRTYLRLPWKPLICIGGTTTYDLDDKFMIARHSERWNVSALEAVGQIFTPSSNNGG